MSAIFTEARPAADLTTASDGPPSRYGADWQARWIMAFLAIGLAARLIRYLLRFPLWGDEAMLAMNLLDRNYAGLMRPLDFHQVSPLLFLWTELTAVKLLGFQEWSLRLFPLLGSIASLFLFHRLARLLLRGNALILAVGIFAVSYSGLRYASETKPYAIDQMVSTLLLWLAVRWWQRPGETGRLWVLTAVTPLALGISYPAVFVAGGVSLAIGVVLLTPLQTPLTPTMSTPLSPAYGRAESLRRGWLAWGAYNLILATSFLVWYKLAIGAQSGAELSVMGRMWDDSFPPLSSLTAALAWLVKVHAGPLLAVPVGGDHWGSLGTTLLCAVAVGVLIRKGRFRLLVLCAAPFALNLLAAAMHRYPYGGHMRLAMHLAPLVCILAGTGLATVIEAIGRRRSTDRLQLRADAPPAERLTWPVAIAMGLLMMLAVLSTARDFCLPGKEQQEIRKRDFAAWFWGSMEREHEVVDISTDLKLLFTPPGDIWENCVSAQFLCNARIYSPRQSRGKPYDLDRVSRQRPLVCVQYWSHLSPYDQTAFDRWLETMKDRYDLIGRHDYPMLQDNDYDRLPEPPDRVELYEFVPKRTHHAPP